MADTRHTESGGDRQSIEKAAADQARSAGSASQSEAKDTMRHAGAVGGKAVDTTHNVLRTAVTATEDVGAGLVGGVTHIAQEMVQGVHHIGTDALHMFTDLMVTAVDGVRQIAGAALHRPNQQPTREASGEQAEQTDNRHAKDELGDGGAYAAQHHEHSKPPIHH
jgi:hypothetical protein